MMKDILAKLSALEASAPKVTKKKMLTEDSTTPPVKPSTKPATLKDIFENMSSQKPIPVVGRQGDTQQTGAGFLNINDTSPAGQAMQKALTDLAGQGKAQIVVPTTPQDAPAQAGAAGVRAVQQVGQGQPMQQKVQETSHGEKTINTSFGNETGDYDVEVSYDFDDYGDIEITGVVNIDDGEDMYDVLSGADLDKLKTDVEMQLQADRDDEGDYRYELSRDKLDELSKKTLGNYINKANNDSVSRGIEYGFSRDKKDSLSALEKLPNRTKGIDRAVDKLTGKAKVPANEGAKVDRMVKHIEKSEKKSGKSKEEAQDIAWATANKRGMLDNKNKKKVKEGDIAPTNGIDTRGAGLGAGRSPTTLESKSISSAVDRSEKQRQNLIKKAARELNSKTKPTTAEELVKKYDLFPKDVAAIKKMAKELAKDKVEEGKKPDFLDLDKDGNKKESMKKAAADKKKQKVKESMNHRISAARLEGKSHGLRGHAHSGKRYEDLDEMRAYHEGFKEGMDELYEMGMYENAPAATVPGMAEQEMDEGIRDNLKKAGMAAALGATALGAGGMAKGAYDYHHKEIPGMGMSQGDFDRSIGHDPAAARKSETTRQIRAMGAGLQSRGNAFDTNTNEDEFGEGNAFGKALAKTPKGGKFTVGGKTYTDRTNYDSKVDEYAFEAWDRELQNLLNEGTEVNEGLSVSVSKGQQNSPDSVTITAQDAEADQLLQLVKHAGLGLFGDEPSEPSSAMSVQPSMGEPDEVGAGGVDVEVVDGSDSMLSLMQKLGGVEASGSNDYEDEEGSEEQLHGNQEDTHEENCMECGGMMEAGHSCGSKMDEEETPYQEEFEVAEDNAPDSDEAETSADEDAEAEEDKALAGAASGDEEEIDEGFTFESIYKKFAMLEGSGDKPKHPEHDEKDDKDFDDAEDEEVTESEQLDELSPELLGRAGVEAGKRQSAAAGPVIDSPLTDPFIIEIDQSPEFVRSTKQAQSLIDRGLLTPDTTVIVTPGGRGRRIHTQAKRIPQLKDLFGNERIGPSKFWGKKVDKFNAAAKNATFRDQAKARTANMSPAQKRQYDAMIKSGELNEWANQTGKGPGKGTDASFEQDIEFMTKVISGGLNKPKSTGQTTVPVIAGQTDRMSNPKEAVNESVSDWVKLAGIKKS
jgi:hypothetical protein